jgi:hypothetical protein
VGPKRPRAGPTFESADAEADDGLFGDRRVDHPGLAELCLEAGKGVEDTAVGAYVLAGDKDVGVLAHQLGEGFTHRRAVGDLAHSLGRSHQATPSE